MNSGPSFIGIGAQKSGTTWLFSNLNEISQIEFLPIKELHYFDRDRKYSSPNMLEEERLSIRLTNPYWLGRTLKKLISLGWRNPNKSWYLKWYFSNYTDDWYLKLFEKTEKISGEITPAYATLAKVDIIAMRNLVGDIPLIFMIRNPIDRAWSAFKYKFGTSDWKGTPEQMKKAVDFFQSEEQLSRSNYLSTINKFRSVFGHGKIIIGFYDAISDQPMQLLLEILEFVGGDISSINPPNSIRSRVNKSAQLSIPKEIKEYLTDLYSDDIRELSLVLGEYCEHWENELIGNRNGQTARATLII